MAGIDEDGIMPGIDGDGNLSTDIEGSEQLLCCFCFRKWEELIKSSKGKKEAVLRVLPCQCQMVSCKECFVERRNDNNMTTCDSCGQMKRITDYADLPIAHGDIRKATVVTVQAADNSQEKVNTCVCKTLENFGCDRRQCKEIAEGYCIEEGCERRYCPEHMESHNELFDDHKVIDWDKYRDNCHLRRIEPSCGVAGHKDHVCKRCFRRSCSKCVLEEAPCAGRTKHDYDAQDAVHNLVQGLFLTQGSEVDAKIAEYKKLATKCKEEDLRKIGSRYNKLNEDVAGSINQDMNDLSKHRKQSLAKIDAQHQQDNKVCGDYQQYIQEKLDILDELKHNLAELNRGPMLTKFDGCQELTEKIRRITEEDPSKCQWKQPLALTSGGPGRKLEVIEVPKSIDFDSPAHRISECCYAVAFQGNLELWVAHESGLGVYKIRSDESHLQPLSSLKKLNTRPFSCTAVATLQEVIYYTAEERDLSQGTVNALLCTEHGYSAPVKVFEYDKADSAAALAACDNFLALSDKKQNKIIIYNRKTRAIESHQFTEFPSGVCFYPDGDLLVTDLKNGTLSKHSISSEGVPDLTTPVVCQELKDPDAICTDSSGLIYVKSNSLKLLYVISNGTLHKTLKSDEIHTTPGGIAIHGNHLKMAGYSENEFKCFILKYDEQP